MDGLFLAIGYRPNTDAFRDWLEVDEKGYLVVNDETHTRLMASSWPATCTTTATARPSPPPPMAARRPSTPSAGWRHRASPRYRPLPPGSAPDAANRRSSQVLSRRRLPISLLLPAAVSVCLLAAAAGCRGNLVAETQAAPSSSQDSPSISSTPSPSIPPLPSVTPSPSLRVGLTREEAIALARLAPGDFERDAPLLSARVERWGDEPRYSLVSPSPEPSRPVWVIDIGEQPSPTGGQGWYIVLDYETGELLSLTDWVS